MSESEARPDRLVEEAADLGVVGKEGLVVGVSLVHVTVEYARHLGHADLAGERIDGRVGR